MRLHVVTEGDGPPVVLVHGGMMPGRWTWSHQLALAERWELRIVDRTGYGETPGDGEDIEADAEALGEVLAGGAHLVGQSSGAVACLLAAARYPGDVRSLTLCEPPAFHLAPDSPAARDAITALDELFASEAAPAEWIHGVVRIISGAGDTEPPDRLPQLVLDGIRTIRAARRKPWHVDVPLDDLAAAPYPKLVLRRTQPGFRGRL